MAHWNGIAYLKIALVLKEEVSRRKQKAAGTTGLEKHFLKNVFGCFLC